MSHDDNTAGGRALRTLVVGLLMLATLGFGAAGLCGAVFTVVGLSGLHDKGPENFAASFLVISVPSLLIGGGVAWWCVHLLLRRWRDDET